MEEECGSEGGEGGGQEIDGGNACTYTCMCIKRGQELN